MTADLNPNTDYPPPLGAIPVKGGVHFTVFSRHATQVELCLYDQRSPARETARLPMTCVQGELWHLYVAGARTGTLYGYRAHGPWLPTNAHRFNPNKLLLDPYARSILGKPQEIPAMQSPAGPGSPPGSIDSAPQMLKSVVVDSAFEWGSDKAPRTPWMDTVIYEAHVKGLSQLCRDVPKNLRGTYAGAAHPAVISYLKHLGVTAVQLLPVHQHLDDRFLLDKGLTNYWGYNTIGFFAPHNEYAASTDPNEVVREFKSMVKALHGAGIEVILDVVYNHTAEGSERGPTLLFRGLDDRLYYRHAFTEQGAFYTNFTGTGNAVDSSNAPALRLIMDSLRYWVTEMHVDGFRFDLAVTVARDHNDHFSTVGQFMSAVAQDPILSGVKLIAEPWDVMHEDSYQVGGFTAPWRELNGRYRDNVRRFWIGEEGAVADFAKRLCGSQDIYGWAQRPATTSVNFLTSHDGFTLADLVSYTQKHNEANGEENRDGDNQNHSTNCGVEGASSDPRIVTLRSRLRRSMVASMLLSVGVPFITGGDESGRTQKGNNNAYCQDNDLSWLPWHPSGVDQDMRDFTRDMLHFRANTPAFRRSRFFDGALDLETGMRDVTWLAGDGNELTHDEWHNPRRAIFGALLAPVPAIHKTDETRPLLVLFNGGQWPLPFLLPGDKDASWTLRFDTSLTPSFVPLDRHGCAGGVPYALRGHTVALFILREGSLRAYSAVN